MLLVKTQTIKKIPLYNFIILHLLVKTPTNYNFLILLLLVKTPTIREYSYLFTSMPVILRGQFRLVQQAGYAIVIWQRIGESPTFFFTLGVS